MSASRPSSSIMGNAHKIGIVLQALQSGNEISLGGAVLKLFPKGSVVRFRSGLFELENSRLLRKIDQDGCASTVPMSHPCPHRGMPQVSADLAKSIYCDEDLSFNWLLSATESLSDKELRQIAGIGLSPAQARPSSVHEQELGSHGAMVIPLRKA